MKNKFSHILVAIVAALTATVAVQQVSSAINSTPSTYVSLSPHRAAQVHLSSGQTTRTIGNFQNYAPGCITALAVQLTLHQNSAPTYATVWPTGDARPSTSILNAPTAWTAVSNFAIVPVNIVNGRPSFDVYIPTSNASIIVDVMGYTRSC